MTKILICGSRYWTAIPPIFNIIANLPPESIVIQGCARGADTIAGEIAESKPGIIVKKFPAKWDELGKRAGYVRNIEMLDQNPDIVYAFPIGESKGTWHTIREARKRGIETIVYGEK